MISTDNIIQRALDLCRDGKFIDAELLLENSKKNFLMNETFLNLVGTLKIQLGKFNEGISYLETSLSVNSYQSNTLINLGLAYQFLNNNEKALFFYNKAAKKFKNIAELYNNRGVVFRDLGQTKKALKDFNAAIILKPNYAEAFYNKALTLFYSGQYSLAKQFYMEVIKILPNHLDAIIGLGVLENKLKKYEDSINWFKKAKSIDSKIIELNFHLIDALVSQKNFDKAWEVLREAEIINHRDYRNSFYRSILHTCLNNFHDAEKEIDLTLNINPNFDKGICHKALLLEKLSRYEEAIEICKNANFKPNYLIVNTLGYLYHQLGELKISEFYYKKALKLKPDFFEAAYSLSLIYLAQKKFKLGWELYKNRLIDKLDRMDSNKLLLSKNYSIESKILIIREQGIGDQILYSSLFNELIKIYPNLIVNVDERLTRIYERSFPNIKFIKDKDLSNQDYNFYLYMGDIPKYFRNKKDDFQSQKKNFLLSNKVKKANFKSRLKNKKNIVCGISWKSLNVDFAKHKNINLEEFIPIFENNSIEFVNIQYGPTDIDLENLKEKFGINLTSFNDVDHFNDLESVFSLIDACDFIITCSNTSAHIAGALGKNTYLLVPYSSGLLWYWHLNDIQSMWYPTIKIFRQKEQKIWSDVIIDVLKDIRLNYE